MKIPERIHVQVNANGEPLDHRWFETDDDRFYNEAFVIEGVHLDALARLDEIIEIYAEMKVFKPKTAAEAYCLKIIKQMYEAAAGAE